MTNREKYAEQIIDMALDSIEIAVDKEGKLCDCNVILCSDCAWSDKNRCRERFKEWAEQEYVEPPVDWSKVPVDTKVYVRDSDSDPWKPRYFINDLSTRYILYGMVILMEDGFGKKKLTNFKDKEGSHDGE